MYNAEIEVQYFNFIGENKMQEEDTEIKCAYCFARLARIIEPDTIFPSCEKMYERGNVAVPNFGWFCGQECGRKYENLFRVRFDRNEKGQIDYYN